MGKKKTVFVKLHWMNIFFLQFQNSLYKSLYFHQPYIGNLNVDYKAQVFMILFNNQKELKNITGRF